MKNPLKLLSLFIVMVLSGCQQESAAPVVGQTSPAPDSVATQAPEQLMRKAASNPLRDAYFGETHIHTAYSLDAYLGGTRLTPSDAYLFAKGESVVIDGPFS